MRHQFVRLFLAIILISLAVIAVQCLVIFIGNWHVAMGWRDMVFEDFVSSLEASIGSLDDADSSNVMNMMLSRVSERISGLLVRDSDGGFILSLGTSPAGEQMPSPEARRSMVDSDLRTSRLKLSYQHSISYTDVDIPAPRYVLSIHTIPNTRIPLGISLDSLEGGSDMTVSLPSIVADQDIAGTIRIDADGETLGYIDVLVYRIDYYGPTLFATKELLFAFIISIPVAFIVSAILAAIVSKWNARSVKEIQASLDSLSKGYYDLDLPEQNTEEMAEIAKSITALGKDLSRHQQSRKEWIRNISHDLNTPVASLNILISGAIDGVFPLDMQLIESMKKENDTLMQRIQSVAYYSYLLSPDAKAQKKPTDIVSALSSAVAGCGIECSIPEEAGEVDADPVLLGRALHEVISNAGSYSAQGTIPRVSVERRAGSVSISVMNDGHLPDPLPQFFEPWARGDASRTSGGSGLGLPIVYQIMELHSGTVSISESDGIVSVVLTFPD